MLLGCFAGIIFFLWPPYLQAQGGGAEKNIKSKKTNIYRARKKYGIPGVLSQEGGLFPYRVITIHEPKIRAMLAP